MTEFFLHLIVNEHAGAGKGGQTAKLVIDNLEKQQIAYTVYKTEHPKHAIDLAAAVAAEKLVPWHEETNKQEPFPLLVVIGGDGTLHEVVNALAEQPLIPVAYIPAGSGNDFARAAKISRQPEEALRHLLTTTKPKELTILSYTEAIAEEQQLFVNNVGIGLDAAIVAAANASENKARLNKFNFGSLSYLSAALKILFRQKGFPISVSANGQTTAFEHAFLCTTTNHPYFGGGVAIDPLADVTQDEFSLIVVERIPLIKIFYLILLLIRKKHLTSAHVHRFVSRHLQIVSTVPQAGQTDGEEMGVRPYDIQFSTAKRLFWL